MLDRSGAHPQTRVALHSHDGDKQSDIPCLLYQIVVMLICSALTQELEHIGVAEACHELEFAAEAFKIRRRPNPSFLDCYLLTLPPVHFDLHMYASE